MGPNAGQPQARSGRVVTRQYRSYLPAMPESQLNTDVALGVTIPARNARGRFVRLGPALDSILSSHGYPLVIERLLAEALALTALLGTMLKEPEGQITLQAQTENGAVELLVCDYLGGKLRGYARHDAQRLAEAGPNPSIFSLFGKGYLAITFDHPGMDERYQGIVPLEGDSVAQAAESFFAQSEQIPSIVRLAAEKRGASWSAGGLLFQHLPEGEEGRERLHTRLDHPDWPHVAILSGSVKADELTDPALALDDLAWRLFHEEAEVRTLAPIRLSKGCRCDPDYVRSVIARFPAEERQAMVGEDGNIRVDCEFCSQSFAISPAELQAISQPK